MTCALRCGEGGRGGEEEGSQARRCRAQGGLRRAAKKGRRVSADSAPAARRARLLRCWASLPSPRGQAGLRAALYISALLTVEMEGPEQSGRLDFEVIGALRTNVDQTFPLDDGAGDALCMHFAGGPPLTFERRARCAAAHPAQRLQRGACHNGRPAPWCSARRACSCIQRSRRLVAATSDLRLHDASLR